MGKTALILVATLSVIVGLYSVGIKKVDSSVERNAATHSYKAQAEEIAKSGVQLAVNTMKSQSLKTYLKNGYKIGLLDKQMLKGTVNFTIDQTSLPDGYCRVTAVGDFKGYEATHVALLKLVGTGKVNGINLDRWRIVRTYVNNPPEAVAFEGGDSKGNK